MKLKSKQLLAVVVAGAGAVALAMPKANAFETVLPVSGGKRTVISQRFSPQFGIATATFQVENLSAEGAGPVRVDCVLESRVGATGSWVAIGEDHISLGGGSRDASGPMEIEAAVRSLSRFTLRVQCTSPAADEPTIVRTDPTIGGQLSISK